MVAVPGTVTPTSTPSDAVPLGPNGIPRIDIHPAVQGAPIGDANSVGSAAPGTEAPLQDSNEYQVAEDTTVANDTPPPIAPQENDRSGAFLGQRRSQLVMENKNKLDAAFNTTKTPVETKPIETADDPLGIKLGNVAKDIGTGLLESPHAVLAGAIDASRNTVLAASSLGDWITNNMVQDKSGTMSFHDALDTVLPKLDKETSNTGQVIRGVSQFLTGFIPALRGVKLLTGGAALTSLGSLAQSEAAAAAVSALVFDPHEARLSNLIQEHKTLANPVNEYLMSKPTDSASEGRFKNAIESLGFGMVAEGFLGGLRFIKAKRIEKGQTFSDRALAQGDKDVYTSGLGGAQYKGITPTFVPNTAGVLLSAGKRTPAELAHELNFDALTGSRSVEKAVKTISGIKQPTKVVLPPSMEDFVTHFGTGVYSKLPLTTIADVKEELAALTARKESFTSKANPSNWDAGSAKAIQSHIDSLTDKLKSFQQKIEPPVVDLGNSRTATVNDPSVKTVADIVGWSPESYLAMQSAMTGTKAAPKAASIGRMDAIATILESSLHKLKSTAEAAAKSVDQGELLDFLRMINVHQSLQLWARGGTSAANRALKEFVMPSGSAAKQLLEINEHLMRAGGEKQIRDLAEQVVQITDPAHLNKTLRNAQGGTVGKLLENAVFFNMLSGLKTQLVNVASTWGQMGWSLPVRSIAAGISSLRGTVNGVTHSEVLGMVRGMVESVTEGIRVGSRPGVEGRSLPPAFAAAKRTWKTNQIDDPLVRGIRPQMNAVSAEQYGLTGPAGSMSWVMGKAVDGLGVALNLPTRALSTADSFNRAIARSAEIRAQAYRSAENIDNIIPGTKAFETRTKELISNPTRDMMEKSVDFSREMVLAMPLDGYAKATLEFLNRHPITKVVVPFFRISVNMAKWVGHNSPIGLLSRDIRNTIAKGGAEGDLALAKITMGSMVGLAAFNLAANGYLTGSGPKDPALNAEWKTAGYQPDSVRVGDEWYSFSRFAPMANLLGAAASYGEFYGQVTEEDAGKIAGALAVATSKEMFKNMYIGDLGEFFDAVLDPDKKAVPYMLKKAQSMLIPQAIGQIAQTKDPVWREVDGLLDAFKSKIPGLSDTLPAHQNLWGEDIALQGALGPDIISPVFTNKVRHDPASDYIYNNKISIGMPTKTQQGVQLTGEEYHKFVSLAGNELKVNGLGLHDAINEMMAGKGPLASQWANAKDGPDGRRAYLIKDMVASYRDAAWKTMANESRKVSGSLWHRINDVVDLSKSNLAPTTGMSTKTLPTLGGQ